MQEIEDKQESSAQGSVARKFVTKCPKCGHTKFLVGVISREGYDGETGEWSDFEVDEIGDADCENCGGTFIFDELVREEISCQ
jgi:ssDNA-binding Zn-finger/Zn-ribbon topoisomerase 1